MRQLLLAVVPTMRVCLRVLAGPVADISSLLWMFAPCQFGDVESA